MIAKYIIAVHVLLIPIAGHSQFLTNGSQFTTLPGSVTGGDRVALGFRTPGSSYKFDRLKLNLAFENHGSISVGFYQEEAMNPGARFSLLSPVEPFLYDSVSYDYSFESDVEVVFEKNSTYFMVLEVINSEPPDQWPTFGVIFHSFVSWSKSEELFTGWASDDPGFMHFSDGSWHEPIFDANYAVDIRASQVPEPMTISAMIGSFALLYALQRRFGRKQAVDCHS